MDSAAWQSLHRMMRDDKNHRPVSRVTLRRIAAFATGATGVPTRSKGATFPAYGGPALPYAAANSATATILTPEWNKVVGVRPQGSPVGLTVAKDGAIWWTG